MPDGKAKQYLAEYLELWHVTDAAYSKLLKRWNLSLNALWVIDLLYRHPEGVEPAVIAELTHTLRQTVTVVLNDLEERGCLYREPNLTDRRRKRIRLTPAGRKFCGHAGVAGAALCGAGLLLAPVQLERQTKGAGECLTEKRSNIWLNISNCGT